MTQWRVAVVCRLPGSGPKLMTLVTLVTSSSDADDLAETFSSYLRRGSSCRNVANCVALSSSVTLHKVASTTHLDDNVCLSIQCIAFHISYFIHRLQDELHEHKSPPRPDEPTGQQPENKYYIETTGWDMGNFRKYPLKNLWKC